MVEFTLPKHSKVQKGKHFLAAKGVTRIKRVEVYRWDPDTDENPRNIVHKSGSYPPLNL
jgi:succinate dehydrogenase / fumarate reductase iron-sulfur subunit